jgi:hypothetical protein
LSFVPWGWNSLFAPPFFKTVVLTPGGELRGEHFP